MAASKLSIFIIEQRTNLECAINYATPRKDADLPASTHEEGCEYVEQFNGQDLVNLLKQMG